LHGDRLVCAAESALVIRELDFGRSPALLRLAQQTAQLVDLCAGCQRHHDAYRLLSHGPDW
jgi:hypothetical protein